MLLTLENIFKPPVLCVIG